MEDFDWQATIDRYYPAGRKARGILLEHSRRVAGLALHIAHQNKLPLSDSEITAAAMLHDIGIIATDAPGIDCHGTAPYLAHGAIGADMLRGLGAPEKYARVAERHTGAGLTPEEIAAAGLPLPPGRDYMPHSLLERLICYADCFYSKGTSLDFKPLDRVRKSMERFGPGVLERFDAMRREFPFEGESD